MSILTIRISEAEKARLAERARSAGVTSGALARQLISEKPFTTAADLLAEMESLTGEKRLKVKARK